MRTIVGLWQRWQRCRRRERIERTRRSIRTLRINMGLLRDSEAKSSLTRACLALARQALARERQLLRLA